MRIVVALKKPILVTLGLVLVFHALLLSLQTSNRFDTRFLRTALLDSLAPVQELVDIMYNSVSNVWEGYVGLVAAQKENEGLRAEIQQLNMELSKHSEDVLEAERLRKLVDLQGIVMGKTIVARVVARDPTQSHQTVTIDKGQRHGVRIDTAIMTPDGVVGRVITAGNWYSIVQLVADAQSAVAVTVRSTRRQGIVKGTGGHDLELDYIDDDNDIKEGDELITSGMDQIHPKGVPLGIVTSVGPRGGILGLKTIKIRPAADLGRLEEVLCVIERPPAIGDSGEIPPPSVSSN